MSNSTNNTTRVFFKGDAVMAMHNNTYVDRDLRAVEEILNSALNNISEDELKLLDRPADKEADDRGQMFRIDIDVQPDKYEQRLKDAEGKETGETVMKDILRTKVWVNFGCPAGAVISMQPSAMYNHLTMGDITLLQKDETGSFRKDEEGKTVAVRGLENIKEEIGSPTPEMAEKKPSLKAFLKVLEALGEVATIKEKALQDRQRSGDYMPYYVAQKTKSVIEGEYDIDKAIVNLYETNVDKMTVLAAKIAEVAPSIKGKKDNTTTKSKYETDAKIRISVERRNQPKLDENGEPITQIKDGKEVAVMIPKLDENGKKIYDSKIELPDVGLVFSVDTTDEQAKLKFVQQILWVGNKPTYIRGFKEINEKASEEVKAYVKAIKDADLFVPYERTNSPLWDLTLKINDYLKKESPVLLDANGNQVLNDKGIPKKEDYASHDEGTFTRDGKEFSFECCEIKSQIDKSSIIRIQEDKNGEFKAYLVLLGQKGESAPRALITPKNIENATKSDAVKAILRESLPYLNDKQCQIER